MNFKPLSNDLSKIVSVTHEYLNTGKLTQAYTKLIANNNWMTKAELKDSSFKNLTDKLYEADYHSWTGFDCGFVYLRIYKKDNPKLVKELQNINLHMNSDTITGKTPEDIKDLMKLYKLSSYSSDYIDLWPNWGLNVQSTEIKTAELNPIANLLNFANIESQLD